MSGVYQADVFAVGNGCVLKETVEFALALGLEFRDVGRYHCGHTDYNPS